MRKIALLIIISLNACGYQAARQEVDDACHSLLAVTHENSNCNRIYQRWLQNG